MQDRLSRDEYALHTDIRLWLGDHGKTLSHNTIAALVRSLRGRYVIRWVPPEYHFENRREDHATDLPPQP